jgi:hypothetical protein
VIVGLGSNDRPQDACWVTPLSYQEVRNQRGYRTHYRHEWTIHEVLIGTDENDLNTKIADHASDYANITGNVVLKHNDSSETEHKIVYANTINGFQTKVSYPGFFPGQWGQHTELLYLRYAVVQLKADVLNVESEIAYYHQSIRHNLGGVGFKCLEAFTGFPQVQFVKQQQKFVAIQSGQIIGVSGYITPPSSFWPVAMHGEDSWWTPETPKYNGRVRKMFYPYSWVYVHSSPAPLVGVPPANP